MIWGMRDVWGMWHGMGGRYTCRDRGGGIGIGEEGGGMEYGQHGMSCEGQMSQLCSKTPAIPQQSISDRATYPIPCSLPHHARTCSATPPFLIETQNRNAAAAECICSTIVLFCACMDVLDSWNTGGGVLDRERGYCRGGVLDTELER